MDDPNITVPFTWSKPMKMEDLPDEKDNPIVWCDRCKKHHAKYAWTKQSWDAFLREQGKAIADNIDAQFEEMILREFP